MLPLGGSGPQSDPHYQGTVLNFSALPMSDNLVDDIYYTIEGQGVWLVNRKPSDYYRWTGTEWRGQANKLVSVTGLGNTGAQEVLSASTGTEIDDRLIAVESGGSKSRIYITSSVYDVKSRTNDNVNWLDLDGATEEQGTTSSDLSSDGFGAVTNDGATREFDIVTLMSATQTGNSRHYSFQILIDGVPTDTVATWEQFSGDLPEICILMTTVSVPADSVVTLGSFQTASATLKYTKFSILMEEV